MEQWKDDCARQVWQRVREGREQPQGLDLRALELAEGENQGAYQRLAGRLGGKQRQGVMNLWERSRENGAILRGIRALTGAAPMEEKPQPVGKEPTGALLRGCYHRTRQLMVEYTARSMEGEAGCVFQALAQRAQADCLEIALILGQFC